MSATPQRRREREEIEQEPSSALIDHRIREESTENAWRRAAVTRLLSVFYALNGAVITFILLVWIAEVISDRTPRMLSERTLLALIAGSTTQLGALALFVGRSLVPTLRDGRNGRD